MKPTLTTARLRLRPVTPADAQNLFDLDADPEVRRYVHMPDAPTLDEVRDQLIPRWLATDAATPAVGYWIAEVTTESGDPDFAGWFHLRPPRPEAGAPLRADDLELGYRLRRALWGRGLATEGGRALTEYGFAQPAAPRVAATALEENAASIRVMEKLGMSRVGRWLYGGKVPAVAYAIGADAWRARA